MSIVIQKASMSDRKTNNILFVKNKQVKKQLHRIVLVLQKQNHHRKLQYRQLFFEMDSSFSICQQENSDFYYSYTIKD